MHLLQHFYQFSEDGHNLENQLLTGGLMYYIAKAHY